MDGTDDKIYQWSLAVPYVLGRGVTAMVYVGIATNLNAYDGMVLQVDVNGPAGKKFKFGGSVGAGGTWSNPEITFTNEVFLTGVTTVSAAATAIVSAAGTITNIYITNAGVGYSVAPTIVVAGAESSGSGTFAFNEIITGSSSGTTSAHIGDDADIRAFYSVNNKIGLDPIFTPFPGYSNLNSRGQVIASENSNGESDSFITKSIARSFDSEKLDYREYTFTADQLPSFKTYRIKISLTSKSQCFVPRIKDLRVIALA